MAALGWVDLFMLAVVAVSVLLGLWRGFVFEVLMLLGWVAGYFAARWFAPDLAPHLPMGTPGSGVNLAAAFALCFVGAVILWGLGAKLIRLMLHATPLSVPDRLLGGVFGVLRGAVLLMALATVVGFTPAGRSAAWQASVGARWLGEAMAVIKPLLPELPPLFDTGRPALPA